MDMFDFSSIIELMKVEPGHGLLQSVLLFMIWIQSRGVRKELEGLRKAFIDSKQVTEQRFVGIENRLLVLEGGKK